MRADGSTKFAPGNQWGYFPSVSGAWVLSEEKFMEEIFKKLALSARMHDRILKVARTTADLAEEEKIRLADLCEAVSYVKSRDKFWGN